VQNNPASLKYTRVQHNTSCSIRPNNSVNQRTRNMTTSTVLSSPSIALTTTTPSKNKNNKRVSFSSCDDTVHDHYCLEELDDDMKEEIWYTECELLQFIASAAAELSSSSSSSSSSPSSQRRCIMKRIKRRSQCQQHQPKRTRGSLSMIKKSLNFHPLTTRIYPTLKPHVDDDQKQHSSSSSLKSPSSSSLPPKRRSMFSLFRDDNTPQ
jgi:hypothetical protein